jgi:hypothetical protein
MMAVLAGFIALVAITVWEQERIAYFEMEIAALRQQIEQQMPAGDESKKWAATQVAEQNLSNSTLVLAEKPPPDLLRLRGEVGVLRQELAEERQNGLKAGTNLQLRLIQADATRIRGASRWSDEQEKVLYVARQNLEALASALNVPTDISKLGAREALDDPDLKQYQLYFRFKANYEATQQVLEQHDKENSLAH